MVSLPTVNYLYPHASYNQVYCNLYICNIYIRVANVVADQDDLLTH